MKKFKENITGVVTVLLLVLNTVFWASFLFPIAVLKIVPIKIWRKFTINSLT
ncbi:MAG: hypothetical protein WBK20_07970 [Spirochaetota bacterium]